MKPHIGVLVRLLVFSGSVVLAGWVWTSTSSVDSAAGEQLLALSSAPAFIDLGAVTSAQSEVSYAVTNRSDAEVRVQILQASCGCMDAEIDRYQILPGESARVTAVIRHNRMGAGAEIPFSRRITVVYATGDEVNELHLIANGSFLPPAWIEEQRAELKKSDSDEMLVADVPVFLRAEPRVEIKATHVFGRDLDCTAEVIDVTDERRSESERRWLRATVRVQGIARKLPATGLLTVTTDSPETPQIRVSLVCQSDDPFAVACVPETLAFGILESGQVATRRAVISWNREAHSRIVAVQASEGFKVLNSPETRPDGTRLICPIEVSTTGPVSTLGELKGHIHVELLSDTDPTKATEIRIPISGFVKAASAEPESSR
ncbi:DUF1573 domain-containing protein [bacterium]|nr:DUF1573 domain-containing protein [bacterium]